MREVIVRFPAHALDDVLDRILPIVPDGVREAPAPRGQIELRMVGPHLPILRDIARAMRPTPFQISEHAVPPRLTNTIATTAAGTATSTRAKRSEGRRGVC